MGTVPTPFNIMDLANDIKDFKIGIIQARWNNDITDELFKGANEVLIQAGIKEIHHKLVPGCFEIPLGAQWMIESLGCNAVIALGCLIKGETPHFEYISEAVSHQIALLNNRYMRPIIFGVLTVNTHQQALDRIGGSEGHKGTEAGLAALEMLQLFQELKSEVSSSKGIGFGK